MRILADNENEIIWERSGTIKVGSLEKYGRLKIYLVIFLPQKIKEKSLPLLKSVIFSLQSISFIKISKLSSIFSNKNIELFIDSFFVVVAMW